MNSGEIACEGRLSREERYAYDSQFNCKKLPVSSMIRRRITIWTEPSARGCHVRCLRNGHASPLSRFCFAGAASAVLAAHPNVIRPNQINIEELSALRVSVLGGDPIDRAAPKYVGQRRKI
jgi:hypothetical protein